MLGRWRKRDSICWPPRAPARSCRRVDWTWSRSAPYSGLVSGLGRPVRELAGRICDGNTAGVATPVLEPHVHRGPIGAQRKPFGPFHDHHRRFRQYVLERQRLQVVGILHAIEVHMVHLAVIVKLVHQREGWAGDLLLGARAQPADDAFGQSGLAGAEFAGEQHDDRWGELRRQLPALLDRILGRAGDEFSTSHGRAPTEPAGTPAVWLRADRKRSWAPHPNAPRPDNLPARAGKRQSPALLPSALCRIERSGPPASR